MLKSYISGEFLSPDVINLSTRTLFKAESSLLSKGLRYIPPEKSVNKAFINEKLECFGRKLRLLRKSLNLNLKGKCSHLASFKQFGKEDYSNDYKVIILQSHQRRRSV